MLILAQWKCAMEGIRKPSNVHRACKKLGSFPYFGSTWYGDPSMTSSSQKDFWCTWKCMEVIKKSIEVFPIQRAIIGSLYSALYIFQSTSQDGHHNLQWWVKLNQQQEKSLNIEKGIYWIATAAPSSGSFFYFAPCSSRFRLHNDSCFVIQQKAHLLWPFPCILDNLRQI